MPQGSIEFKFESKNGIIQIDTFFQYNEKILKKVLNVETGWTRKFEFYRSSDIPCKPNFFQYLKSKFKSKHIVLQEMIDKKAKEINISNTRSVCQIITFEREKRDQI